MSQYVSTDIYIGVAMRRGGKAVSGFDSWGKMQYKYTLKSTDFHVLYICAEFAFQYPRFDVGRWWKSSPWKQHVLPPRGMPLCLLDMNYLAG